MPPYAAFAFDLTKDPTRQEYRNLMRRIHRQYDVTKAQSHRVVVNEDGIPNWEAIYLMAPVQNLVLQAGILKTTKN